MFAGNGRSRVAQILGSIWGSSLAQGMAGSLTTMILADCGAEVIRLALAAIGAVR
jgi:hypothetical protein